MMMQALSAKDTAATTEARMNQTALNNKLKELLVLNGNQPFTPGRPMPGVCMKRDWRDILRPTY